MSAGMLAVADGWVIARRNLLELRRAPHLLVFTLIQPVMLVLLFAYVFGGAITVPEVGYREYLLAGVLVQTAAFGSGVTSVKLAQDVRQGIVDRFRSLPMSRAAVLLGRTTADVVNSLAVTVVMAACGLVIGWRIHTGPAPALAGLLLLLAFGYVMSWISATVGLSVGSVEAAYSAGHLWLFPLTFVSNAFVTTDTLPQPLQAIADWNPVSAITLALRDMWGNAPVGPARGSGFPAAHPVAASWLWIVGLLAVFVPLAVHRYRIAARR
jgi:ABC-2 type transport system permease protein